MKTTIALLVIAFFPAFAFGQSIKAERAAHVAGICARFQVKDSVATAQRHEREALGLKAPKIVWADSVLVGGKYLAKKD